jgi:hypothetical protein
VCQNRLHAPVSVQDVCVGTVVHSPPDVLIGLLEAERYPLSGRFERVGMSTGHCDECEHSPQSVAGSLMRACECRNDALVWRSNEAKRMKDYA